MTRPTCPGKVTAVITRNVGGRTELCVFDHAGVVQLPAGTLEPDEIPIAGAVREAWEETGLTRLEVVAKVATLDEYELAAPERAMMVALHDGCPVTRGHTVTVLDRSGPTVTIHAAHHGWTGVVDAECISRDVTRHVFHLRATEPVPDEWWVLTPDGFGSQWRCRWTPLDGDHGLGMQARWVDPVRDLLDPGPAIGRLEPNPPGTDEVFDATNGIRLLITPIDAPRPDATLGSSYGVCVTADGDAVVVTHDPSMGWSLPGGRPEPGETAEQTFSREVREEACARVVQADRLLTTRDRFLADDRRVHREHVTSLFWARVELDEWAPEHEMIERRLVPLADLADELRWEIPTHLQLHRLAFDREGRA